MASRILVDVDRLTTQELLQTSEQLAADRDKVHSELAYLSHMLALHGAALRKGNL